MEVAVCIFCGLPGSGKTTLAEKLSMQPQTGKTTEQSCSMLVKDFTVIHVSYDAIMPSVKHNETSNGEISAWKAARTCILKNIETCISIIKGVNSSLCMQYDENIIPSELDLIFQSVKTALSENRSVVFVIDDNMHYKGMRYEYYQISRKFSVGFSTVFFDIPVKQCLLNNRKRSENVPENVIVKLSNLTEIPGSNPSCKWEKYICLLSPIDLVDLTKACQKVWSVVKQSMANPPPQLSETSEEELEFSRMNIRKSFIHQADLCMRKFISSEIRTAQTDSRDIRSVSRQLACVKSKLLSIMKSGYVDEETLLGDNGIVDLVKLGEKIDHLMRLELEEIGSP